MVRPPGSREIDGNPVDHFLGRLLDRPGHGLRERTQGEIGLSGMLLDQAQSANERPAEAQLADREILNGPSCLGPVVSVDRDAHLPH